MIARRLACLAVLIACSISHTPPVSLGSASADQGKVSDRSHDWGVPLPDAITNGRTSIPFTEPSPTGNMSYPLHKP